MHISLTPDQEARISAYVADGHFSSVEEAVREFVDQGLAGFDDDDLAWAKPLVDEARAAVERREVMTLEQHQARMDAHLARLKE